MWCNPTPKSYILKAHSVPQMFFHHQKSEMIKESWKRVFMQNVAHPLKNEATFIFFKVGEKIWLNTAFP